MLGEPPRTQWDLHFNLFGFPVRVHPLFWVVAALLGVRSSDGLSLIMWMVAVFVAVLLHELGHAVVMRSFGFHPWITLYGMGGLASYHPGSSSARGNRPGAQILISAAGPLAGFLLAAVILVALNLAGYRTAVGFVDGVLPYATFEPLRVRALNLLLFSLLQVSIYWGLLNLLPILPLDGGQIAREVLVGANPRDGLRQTLMLSIFAAGAIALLGLLRWDDIFLAMLFGYLGYSNYMTLQAYRGGGYW